MLRPWARRVHDQTPVPHGGAPGAPVRLDLTDGRSIADGRLPGPRRRDDQTRPDLVGAAVVERRRHELLDVATAAWRGVEHAPPRVARRPQLPKRLGVRRPRPGLRSPRPLSEILRPLAARAPARGRAPSVNTRPRARPGPPRRARPSPRGRAARDRRGSAATCSLLSTAPHWTPPNNVTSASLPPRCGAVADRLYKCRLVARRRGRRSCDARSAAPAQPRDGAALSAAPQARDPRACARARACGRRRSWLDAPGSWRAAFSTAGVHQVGGVTVDAERDALCNCPRR